MRKFETKIIQAVELKERNRELKNIFQEILEEGDHILVDHSLESNKEAFIKKYLPLEELEIDFVDIRDFSVLKNSIKSNTRILYFQIASEKDEELTIIEGIGDIAKNISSELKVLIGTE